MGDYGFKAAAESGGMDCPMSDDILKDILNGEFHFTKCPSRKPGLFGDDPLDVRHACELTYGSDADGRGFGYDECDYVGDDYRGCPRYSGAQSSLNAVQETASAVSCCSIVGKFHKLGNLEDDTQAKKKKDFHYRCVLQFTESGLNFFI